MSVHMRRGLIVAVAVAGTAAAVHFGERTGETASAERARPPEPQTASQAEFIAEPRRQPLGAARGGLFAVPRTAPVPQPTTPAVAPEPSGPSFPYRYGGWLDAGSGAGHVFLKGSHALPGIRVGEMLDGVWRLDAVSADRIEVSFVPGGQQLSMSLASLMHDPTTQSGTSSGAVAVPGRTFTSTPTAIVTLPPASAQSAARRVPLVAGLVPAQASPGAGPATGATSSPMQPGPAPSGTMPSSPAPAGRLGIDTPGSGSMPTGPAQSGTSGKKLGL